jgi:glycosyltransferase involved in cell wall biosynthesis
MRIVQIGTYPLDITCIQGGVEASVYGLAKEQAKKNQVFVFDIPRYDIKKDTIEKTEEISVFRFRAKRRNNYSPLLRLKTILTYIRQQQPDVCHLHTTGLFSLITYLLLKTCSLSTVVTIHGLAHIEKQNLWHKQPNIRNFAKYCVQSLTEFIFISLCPTVIVDTQYVADAIKTYRKQWKILRMPTCRIIPQGVNAMFFQLENGSESKHLLSVGSISKRKGHLYMIDAMEKVKNVFPDVSLTIAGALLDAKYYQLIREKITEKGLENNVEVLTDVSFENLLKLYTNSEIFVLHSEEESQGIVFCEAMAAGQAIVATNVGGVPWVIKPEWNGLLSGFGDINSFANNVITLLSDDQLRKRMEKTNRMESEKYGWRYIADQITAIYKAL